MILKTVTYTRLVNLGNYENESLSLTVEAEEGDTAKEIYNAIKTRVEELLKIENNEETS